MKRTLFFLALVLVSMFIIGGCTDKLVNPADGAQDNSNDAHLAPGDQGLIKEPESNSAYPLPSEPTLDANQAYPQPNEPIQSGDGSSMQDDILPRASDKQLKQSKVYIEGSEIILMETYPVQAQIHIWGNLPTPCNKLRASVQEPDEEKRIHVMVYSVVNPDTMCIQVIAPFDINVPIGNYTEGNFTVWLNGEKVGEINLP